MNWWMNLLAMILGFGTDSWPNVMSWLGGRCGLLPDRFFRRVQNFVGSERWPANSTFSCQIWREASEVNLVMELFSSSICRSSGLAVLISSRS